MITHRTYLITIVFFFIYLNSFSQDLNRIKLRLNLLETNIDFKLDSTGISNLILPTYVCSENKSRNNWHIQDINRDGLKDLIFSGFCPYYQAAIFLNSKNGFKLVYDYPGKILSITNKLGVTKIHILKPNIACEYYSELIQVSIKNKIEIQKHTISFHFDTKIKVNDVLDNQTISGILRSTPIKEDSTKKDPCTESRIIGNQIGTIANKNVVILNKRKDWFLVLVDKSDTDSLIGWIKK